jgi:hypothetical protein
MPLDGSYLDRAELKVAIGGIVGVRAQLVDGTFLEVGNQAAWQSFVEDRLVIATSEINARLRKRYAAPFATPVPKTVIGWLAALVLPELYEARGWDDSDAHAEDVKAGAARAREQMKEAADSEIGLFDLPLRQDVTGTGIAKGGPLGYSEQSPYSWTDAQADEIRGGGV